MSEKDELTVVPTGSFVFIGPESEWKEILQGSSWQLSKVLLLGNDNTLEIKELVWCEEKNILIVPSERISSFNIDNFANNYQVYSSNSVTPLTNKTKAIIEQEEKKRIEEEKRVKRQKELQEQKILNAKVISINDLDEPALRGKLYAINFDRGTNFQRQLVQGKGCHRLNHNLHLVVGILIDKNGCKKRIGKVFVCTTCGKTYLGKSTNETINQADYPSYTFDDWPKDDEKVGNKELFGIIDKQEEWAKEKTEQYLKQAITKAEKSRQEFQLKYPQKDNDTVLLDEKMTAYYGDDLIHKDRNGHKLITCKVGILKSGKKRYEFYKGSKYCPICNRFYLFPIKSIKVMKQKHPYNVFKGGSFYAEQIEIEKKRIQYEKEEQRRKKAEKVLEKENRKKENYTEEPQTVKTENIGAKDFLVRTGAFSCRRNGHKCKEIAACVTLIRPKSKIQDVVLSGWYCENCKCYYISEADFQKLDKMGVIVAKVYTEKEWRKQLVGRKEFSELSSQSLLNKLGYNVNASQGLNDSTRRDILASALDYKLMNKREMIDFLTWLINFRSGNNSMQNAIAKWESDINFVSNYKLNSKQFVRIKSIALRDIIYY